MLVSQDRQYLKTPERERNGKFCDDYLKADKWYINGN